MKILYFRKFGQNSVVQWIGNGKLAFDHPFGTQEYERNEESGTVDR